MPETFYIRDGDTAPVITAQPRDGRGKALPPLAVDTTSFVMWQGDAEILNRLASYDSDLNRFEYEWEDDHAPPKGTYRARFDVVYTNGKKGSFPNSDRPAHQLLVVVSRRAAPEE